MSSDRFGEIRIKPETEKASQGRLDDEIIDSTEKTGSVDIQPAKAVPSVSPHPRAGEIKRKHPSFRPGRGLLWVAVPLFFVLLYGVGSYFLVPSLIKGPLAKNLAEILGRPVAVSRVIFSPFSLRVFLKDVSVGPVYGDLNRENLLECTEFFCRIDFPGLMNRQLICHEARADGVTVNLIRLRLGFLNIAEATNFFSLIRGRSGQVLWPGWFVLDGLQLTNGKIVVDDSLANKQHRIEQIRFYLPSAKEAGGQDETMPRLNAVVNSSPVQIDGRRQKNTRGTMETSFNLKFTEIVLKNYLDYIPSLQQNPFHLEEGQADVDVELVIPELGSATENVTVQLDAALEALRFTDSNGGTLLKVPAASLNIHALPSRNYYNVKNIEFNNAELTIRDAQQTEQNQHGLTAIELNNFLQGLEEYPYGISIENLSISGGKVDILPGKQKSSRYVWEEGNLKLTGFYNRAARESQKAPPPSSSFWISSREKGAEGGQVKVEGNFSSPAGYEGKFSASNIDLQHYSAVLPEETQFAEGQADIEGSFSYTAASGDDAKSSRAHFQLRSGILAIRNYALLRGKKTVLAAGETICRDMRADSSAKELTCESVSLVKGRVDADSISLAALAGNKREEGQWKVQVRNLDVRDSQLHMHVINPFDQDQPVFFELNNFSLQGVNLQDAEQKSSNLKGSAVIGSKGKLLLHGTYSAATGMGLLQTTLREIRLQDVRAYLSPWFRPEIRDGKINAEGVYLIREKEFSGKISIEDLKAGQADGPALEWQEAATESLTVKLNPLTLECGEIQIIRPYLTFGIAHPEQPVSVFLKPVEEIDIPVSVAIQTVRFDEGVFALPEPLVSEGYQPDLTNLAGSIGSVGTDSMDFSIRGDLDGQSGFTIQGTSGMNEISHYRLDVANIALGPFQPLFAANIGINVRHAKGSWQQEMRRSDAGFEVFSRVHLQGIDPDPDSEYFKITALYTDEQRSIQYTGKEIYPSRDERIFLFDLFFRGMKHDAVRAELSEQLILNKLLPDLELPGRVAFVPGTATLVVTKALADYEILLGKRPLLRLELVGNYDPGEDAQALAKILQQEEDARREAENRRRTEERRKIEEQEMARLEELKKNRQQVVEEKIPQIELSQDLQPLPYREVKVKPEMLVELAHRRADALYRFFIDGLLVPPERIQPAKKTGETAPEVRIAVLPAKSLLLKEQENSRNDPTVN